jgi:hypothetical protein
VVRKIVVSINLEGYIKIESGGPGYQRKQRNAKKETENDENKVL